MDSTVGIKNPYRYRGYRYDTETGLYYLQSRYYNPEWGRFINADGIVGYSGELLGHNLFAYCKNNPINMKDLTGFYATDISGEYIKQTIFTIITVVVIGTINKTFSIIDSAIENNKVSSKKSKSTTTNKGRSKNKLKPDTNAQGDHSTFKRDPLTGEVTNYKTYRPNVKNPSGFDEEKGYDGTGSPHTNPVTGEDLMPHVHDKTVPGGVREPYNWEVPGRR